MLIKTVLQLIIKIILSIILLPIAIIVAFLLDSWAVLSNIKDIWVDLDKFFSEWKNEWQKMKLKFRNRNSKD